MFKKLSLFLVVAILAMSMVCVPVGAEKAQDGRAYVLSFDDGSYSQVLGGDGLDDVVITDEVSETEGGKSLCWTKKDNNSVTLLFSKKGVENLEGKKTLHIRAFGKNADNSESVSRMNIVVYNRSGSGEFVWSSYPVTGNKWTTIDIDFQKIPFWSDAGVMAIRFEARGAYANGDKLYIDSAWFDCSSPATFTEKNDAGSKTVLDFNTITAKGSHDINSNTGIKFGYTDDTDFDSSNALYFNVSGSNHNNTSALFVRCMHSTSETHYHEQMNWNEYDNVVFRMKGYENEGSAVTSGLIYITFSSGYATRLADDRSFIASADVSFDEWRDYKIPLSQFNNFPDNIRSMVITSQKTATSDFGILLDSVFLTKDAPATLEVPSVAISGNDVNTYLEGDNTVNFTFAQNLAAKDYAPGVVVYKNGAVSDEAFVTNVNGNVLSVTFADALAAESSYMVILDKNYIRDASGNAMAKDAVCTFTTGKADFGIDSIEIVKGENSVSANAVASNNTNAREEFTLFIAAYEGNKLVTVQPQKTSFSAVSGGMATAAIDEISDVDAYTYKAFAWNSISGLIPITAGK